MAGDWIKMRTDLWTCPQVVRIAARLKRARAHIVGALCYVWSTFDAHSSDGSLPKMPPGTFDQATETEGLEAALIEVGWLEIDAKCWTLPRYEEHNGPTAKRRAQEQKRKKRVRIVSASNADQRRGEERREEKSKGKPLAPYDASAPELPTCLQTEAFRKAWAEWIEHRKQIHKKLTPLAVTKQLTRLAAMGETRALATLEHTIEKGWIGLQEPDRPAGEKPAFTSRGRNLGGDQ
ncbi:MAG: hypothetical protein V3U39_12305 [Acidimicrobiia bacterium]